MKHREIKPATALRLQPDLVLVVGFCSPSFEFTPTTAPPLSSCALQPPSTSGDALLKPSSFVSQAGLSLTSIRRAAALPSSPSASPKLPSPRKTPFKASREGEGGDDAGRQTASKAHGNLLVRKKTEAEVQPDAWSGTLVGR